MKFKVNLNGFSVLEKENPRWPGKKVRFNLMWWLEDGEGIRSYWMEMRGCLASLTERGDLIWSPPLASGKGYKYCVVEVNDALYNEVKRVLQESKWFQVLLKNDLADLSKVTV